MNNNKKEYYTFMFGISVILLVVGTIFLITSAFMLSKSENSGFIVGLILAFTGLGVFLYDIVFQ